MTNRTGIEQFISLWNQFQRDETLPRGLGRFKTVFEQLKEVRFWGIQDRLEESAALVDWRERVQASGNIPEFVNVQIELWYRKTEEKRRECQRSIEVLIQEEGGAIIDSSAIESIEYHGLLVRLPMTKVDEILAFQHTKIISCEQLMFFRAAPQGFYNSQVINTQLIHPESEIPDPASIPHLAVLDGLPVENHTLLSKHVIVDDWKDWARTTPAKARKHGTQIASTIIHGDLSLGESPLNRKILILPILQSSFNEQFGIAEESTPIEKLDVDFIHNAILRVVNNHPTVRIINLSYGDRTRAFYRSLSPLARLIDWLSYEHNLLFFVSAGNYSLEGINLEVDENNILKKIHSEVLNRKIMSPSESINSLTVGSLNSDASTVVLSDNMRDFISEPYYPSPISASGLGFKSSVKPDFVMPGGKILFKKSIITDQGYELSGHMSENVTPGILSAVTSPVGRISDIGYIHGTSFSCALASRLASQVLEVLTAYEENQIDVSYYSLLIKAMISHGASWEGARESIFNIFHQSEDINRNQIKDVISRLIGYGKINNEKCLFSTDSRAFIIGTADIKSDEGVIFEIPLPSSLNAVVGRKRITVTLAWFSPINPGDKRYRKAQLWFDQPVASNGDDLRFKRLEADWRAVKRGTLQHEIFETEAAIAFGADEKLLIQVNCKQEASGRIDRRIKFALAVSVEAEEALNINVYNEIQSRITTRIPILS